MPTLNREVVGEKLFDNIINESIYTDFSDL